MFKFVIMFFFAYMLIAIIPKVLIAIGVTVVVQRYI